MKQFQVYKDMLCARSKFFNSKCSKTKEKGTNETIRLTQVDSSIFGNYITWVYSNDIDVERYPSTEEKYHEEHQSLMDLYRLGDILDDSSLRKRILWLFVTREEHHKTLSPIRFYSVAFFFPQLRGSPLRKLLIDMYIQRADKRMFAEDIPRMSEDFKRELMMELMQRIGPDSSSGSFRDRLGEYIEAETVWTRKRTAEELTS